jgi:hypothetical protein
MIADMKSNLFSNFSPTPSESTKFSQIQSEITGNDEQIDDYNNIDDENNYDQNKIQIDDEKDEILEASEPKVEELPQLNDSDEDREDFDDGEEKTNKIIQEESIIEQEAIMKNVTFGGNISEAMNIEDKKIIGDKIDQDLARYNTIERIKDYLESEIGNEVLSKAHPVLKEFGDDILYENNIPSVIEKLNGILSEEEIAQYLHFFASWIFFENEQERINKKNNTNMVENKAKETLKDPVDLYAASFRDLPNSEAENNIFKNHPNQAAGFDATAKFGFQH